MEHAAQLNLVNKNNNAKKKRKSRTAFTNHQVYIFHNSRCNFFQISLRKKRY